MSHKRAARFRKLANEIELGLIAAVEACRLLTETNIYTSMNGLDAVKVGEDAERQGSGSDRTPSEPSDVIERFERGYDR